jgi:hypothetical protein
LTRPTGGNPQDHDHDLHRETKKATAKTTPIVPFDGMTAAGRLTRPRVDWKALHRLLFDAHLCIDWQRRALTARGLPDPEAADLVNDLEEALWLIHLAKETRTPTKMMTTAPGHRYKPLPNRTQRRFGCSTRPSGYTTRTAPLVTFECHSGQT